MQKWNVIGVMSGTSLDGLDLVYTTLSHDKHWSYTIHCAKTFEYEAIWHNKLKKSTKLNEKELKQFHKEMNSNLEKKRATIDKFFYCPFHPNGKIKKYKKKSNLRKPGNGMLLKAMKKFKLRPSECAMIGDQKCDYLSAKKTKIYFEYKKNYALDIQINNVLKKFNGK